MNDVTISMPEELALKVRILAAKAEKSVSQYICSLAEEKVDSDVSV